METVPRLNVDDWVPEQSQIVPQRKIAMVTFTHFCERCRTRHDFDDQIQVRYQHGDEEEIDTWVSGTEAIQRLRSEVTEEELKGLSRMSVSDLRIVIDSLPEMARNLVRRTLRDKLADRLSDNIGGNVIGDSLSDSIRGKPRAPEHAGSEKERWRALLRYDPFRQEVLELAWIQLEGSFPETEPDSGPDDWL